MTIVDEQEATRSLLDLKKFFFYRARTSYSRVLFSHEHYRLALDRFLWEHKVARKVKVFWKPLVGNFCQYHFCCTLIMGRRKFCARDWWNAEACWFKFKKSGTPHKPTRREHAAPSLHTPHDTQAPSASHQLVWHSIWRYPTKRLHCQLISR